jgi:hypothetical protein
MQLEVVVKQFRLVPTAMLPPARTLGNSSRSSQHGMAHEQ